MDVRDKEFFFVEERLWRLDVVNLECLVLDGEVFIFCKINIVKLCVLFMIYILGYNKK